MTDLDAFIEDAKQLAADAEEGRRIKEATQKGSVKTPFYERDPAPGYDGEIRSMASQVVIGIWNKERRPVKLSEIYQGVREKIQHRIEDSDWPKVWLMPSKRTCDRRVNEAADLRFFESESETTPIICLKAGTYVCNPALFEQEVKDEILGDNSK